MFNHRWIALAGVLALLASGCGSEDGAPSTLADGDQLTIVMDEFSYAPSSLDLQAGTSVTLTFVNEGVVDHEVMLGSSVAEAGGYENDLLARMQPEVLSGSGYSVSFSEPADMQGVAYFEGEGDHTHDDEPTATTVPGGDHPHDGTEPADHHDDEEPTGTTVPTEDHAHDGTEADDHHDDDDDHATDDHHDDDDHATDDHHDDDDHATDDHHEGEAGHHGDHILVEPGGEVTVRLSVPDDAGGTWEIGCFIDGHYEGGMFGPVTVGPAAT